MANTKRTTTGRTASSGSTTSKGASSKAPASKAASITPDENNLDEFDEFDAVRQLQAKAEAAAQEAETAAQEAESAAQEAEEAAQEAEAAAEAAMAARAALSQRSNATPSGDDASDDDAPSHPTRSARRAPKPSQPSSNENYLGMMSGLLGDMSANNWDDDKFDEMSQSVAMVMGTGPAFATLDTMLANSTAQSSVLMNATQMQRQLDMVGLSCTSACVQQLLNMNNGTQDSD